MTGNGPTSSAPATEQWWPLLRKLRSRDPWPLLLVIHGHSGGMLPPLLKPWLEPLAEQRGAPVWVQALTAEPLLLPPDQRLLLVPLLLTPGSHVRDDIPAIRDRLRGAGHHVVPLPFLGAWGAWLEHLSQLASAAKCSTLLHHPLRQGVADRYLATLQRRLALTPLSSSTGPIRQPGAAAGQDPLPLALAPNRMTAQLQDAGIAAPALLERPATRDLLFNLLLNLP